MKKIKLLTLALLVAICALAQPPAQKKHLGTMGDAKGGVVPTGTSMEEWLYATKGYADDISKGKDPVKEGYSFVMSHSYRTRGDNTMMVFNFIEMKDKTGIRAVIIQVEKVGNYTYYGLPTHLAVDSVDEAFKTQLNLMDGIRAKLLLSAVNDYFMAKLVGGK